MGKIDPPVRSIALPEAVAAVISEWMEADRTGSVTLHMHQGSIRHVETRQVVDMTARLTAQAKRA